MSCFFYQHNITQAECLEKKGKNRNLLHRHKPKAFRVFLSTSRIGMGYNKRVAKRNRFFINLIKDKWGRDSGLNLLHSNFYGVIITQKMAKKFYVQDNSFFGLFLTPNLGRFLLLKKSSLNSFLELK